MNKLSYISLSEIKRIRENIKEPTELSFLLSNIFRINTLSMIMEAGSGHIGTCFSSLDILTWLWTQEMNNPNEIDSDIYFSSKGHDAPAFYSLLIGLEKLDYNLIHKLRRLNGLPGHPDVYTPYIITNTGSLGMGIAKARGLAKANRLKGIKSHIYVLLGDGELQEGQNWESMQPTSNNNYSEITVIIDHNKIQSDTFVNTTSDLGNLEEKFKSFGWEVKRCNGHDFNELRDNFKYLKTVKDKPQILIADTIKGKGVSFMESSSISKDELYKFHSGAPSYEIYEKALNELLEIVNKDLDKLNQDELKLDTFDLKDKVDLKDPQKLIKAYEEELALLGDENKELVVLDADLSVDCGLLTFKKKFPDRFIECGIAEQDMVSMAGGLALAKKIPIVHSFACFLSTRANEQIYNNATEETKIIYVGSLAGIIPAGPGHSHQSVRDISALGSIPNLIMIEPATEMEVKQALRWAVNENKYSTYIRLVSIPFEQQYEYPNNNNLKRGQGIKVIDGKEVILFTYGPIMLNEAIQAAKILKKDNIDLAIYNLPWLNEIDKEWLINITKEFNIIFTLDDHYLKYGQGSMVSDTLSTSNKKVISLGLTEVPECGLQYEVLKHHKLDSESIADTIKNS